MRILLAVVAALFLTLVARGQETQGPRQATLTQQKMCADQAKKAFNDLQDVLPNRVTMTWEYTSHYDAKANVCYMMTTRFEQMKDTKTRALVYVVSDAFEGRVYANYLHLSEKDKADYEVKPQECSVKPRGQPEITCKNSDEFEQLVDKHFGIGR
jgi:hypothetical protein